MIKITFILPYASIAKDVESAFHQLHRPDIQYEILTVTNSEEDLIGKLSGDVVIARGFASHFFQSRKPRNMISVEIPTSGADIILAVLNCMTQHHKKNIAILGNKTIIDSCHYLERLFSDVTFQYCRIKDRSDVRNCIENAIVKGAEAFIGGGTTCRIATQLNLPSTLIQTGPEAIAKSLDIAIQLVEETRHEHEQFDRISKIMKYSYSGIIATNAKGIITSINQKACDIFHTTEKEAIGQPFSLFVPQSDITALISENRILLDEIYKMRYGIITLSCVPLTSKTESSGTVITCQEARELQKTEAKLRKKILERGFIAKYHFDDIIYKDKVMDLLIQKAKRFSQNESNVFIYGQTGVGKELFAQSIHNASHRKNGPFVAINCAALPEQLLESELFGYVEGAFTGASKNGKIGLFEAAHHGTIFLDEIGDMSLKLQGRLLRVLQEKEIVRLGGDHVIPIDVRVISATNKDLNEESHLGNFRSDLMYRLDVLKIVIPPLRKRKHDIIPLCLYFMEEICKAEGIPVFTDIDKEARTLLQNYPWHGNIRQLRNVVQRICVLCESEVVSAAITAEALELPLVQDAHTLPSDYPSKNECLQNPHSENFSREEMQTALSEREIIEKVLEANQFHKGKTAAQLGIDRSTLWRKMQKYSLL